MPSFQSFCADHALRQRREGYEVGTVTGSPHSSLTWRREAWGRWEADEESKAKQGDELMIEEDELRLEDIKTVIAAAEKRVSGGNTRVISYSFAAEEEVKVILSSLEAMLRLFFFNPDDKALLRVIKDLSKNVTELQMKNIMGLGSGQYPEVCILYEFYSLRRLLKNWDGVVANNQKAALKAAFSLAVLVRSPEYDVLQDRLKVGLLDPLTVMTDLPGLIRCLDEACHSTPYAFPDVCHDVLIAVYPHYNGPMGSMANSNDPKVDGLTGVEITSSDGECVENIIGLGNLPTNRNDISYKQLTPTGSRHRRRRRCVTSQVDCNSKYHVMYSTSRKYASNECQFCVVCHMMEILFNGCTFDCCWKHRPTEGRIAYHLRKFPPLQVVALQRLAELRRGVDLTPVDNIPLNPF